MFVKPVSCRMGSLLTNGMTAVIMSLDNTNVTLNIGGQSFTVDMSTKFADDRNVAGAGPDLNGDTHVCYIGTQIITGLNQLTKYKWTATQGVNVDTGYQWTSTNKKASHIAIAPATCLNMSRDLDITGFAYLKHYIDTPENPPLLAMPHTDDICYADKAFSGVIGAASNSQGKQFTGGVLISGTSNTYTQYDYGLFYAAWFGILEPFYNTTDINKESPLLTAGLEEAMQYVLSRLAFIPSAGDHEYNNNLGWGVSMNDYPNGYHQTGINDGTGDAVTDGNYDGHGLLVYNQCMEPLQGSTDGFSDTISKHHFTIFGGLLYFTMDATTRAIKNTRLYDTVQITDALNKIDGSQWFTMFGVPASGCRPGNATNAYPNYETYVNSLPGLAQVKYKNENFVQAEYDLMWRDTGNTPPSLMANDFSNGVMGMAFMVRGDWHQPGWFRWTAPAATGKAAENIHEIGLQAFGDTVYGGNFFQGADRDTQLALDNCELVGAFSATEIDPTTIKPNPFTITITEINGLKSTPEMTVTQWGIDTPAVTGVSESDFFTNQDLQTQTDAAGNLWRSIGERRFVLHDGNTGRKLDDSDFFQYVPSSVGSE